MGLDELTMTSSESAAGPLAGSGRGRYLIGADDPALLRKVADELGDHRYAGALLRRAVGSAPDALVVEADDDALDRLRGDYPGRLQIEIDAELPGPGPAQPPGVG
jgi:hypothetical protein